MDLTLYYYKRQIARLRRRCRVTLCTHLKRALIQTAKKTSTNKLKTRAGTIFHSSIASASCVTTLRKQPANSKKNGSILVFSGVVAWICLRESRSFHVCSVCQMHVQPYNNVHRQSLFAESLIITCADDKHTNAEKNEHALHLCLLANDDAVCIGVHRQKHRGATKKWYKIYRDTKTHFSCAARREWQIMCRACASRRPTITHVPGKMHASHLGGMHLKSCVSVFSTSQHHRHTVSLCIVNGMIVMRSHTHTQRDYGSAYLSRPRRSGKSSKRHALSPPEWATNVEPTHKALILYLVLNATPRYAITKPHAFQLISQLSLIFFHSHAFNHRVHTRFVRVQLPIGLMRISSPHTHTNVRMIFQL